jgi:outer membrane protein assembly factor BamB
MISRLLGPLFLAAPLLCLAAPVPGNLPASNRDDWLLFRGNAQQSGIADSRLPDKLETLWTFKTEDAIENAVAVSGRVVFAGSMDENLYAIDLAKGKQKWKYKGAPFKAAPAVRGGLVYAGDIDGNLHCLDAAKGTKKWIFESGAEIGGVNFHGPDILFASHDENLYCVDKNGKKRWNFKTSGQIYGSPAVADGKTFLVGCDSLMHVIDVNKGREIRKVNLGAQTGASASVVASNLYVGTMGNQVQSIDWKKGAIDWQFKPDRRGAGFFSSPATTDKVVVIGGRDNKVYCIDRLKGDRLWSFPTGGEVDSSPVIAGNRVVIGSKDSNLYVLDLASGKQVQKITLDSPITASPVVVSGKVLIGTQKGTLFCLGKK